MAVSGLELPENLGLAHHHRIEARGDAEDVVNGFLAFAAIEVRFQFHGVHAFALGEKSVDDGLGVGAIVGGDYDLHAIAGGENHGFGDACVRPQIGQRGGQGLFTERKPLTHRNGRRLVAHAGDQQLHCFKKMAPRRACAAQVNAEKPSTVTVMMAALRPRHPAVVRRKTRAI